MANIDALLFDMDGLLLDTERVFMEALVAVGAPEGLAADDLRAFFLTLIGTSGAQTSAQFAAFLPAHLNATDLEARWRDENKRRLAGQVPLRPGVARLIPALAQQDWRMAVVTSTKRAPALDHLARVGLLGCFELVIAGDEVPANKPDPAPYRMAAEALGVDPRRCAAFEDSDTGTQAALAAGCITTQIPDLRPDIPLPKLGQAQAPSLEQALAALGVLGVQPA